MPVIGTNIAASLAGALHAERVMARPPARPAPPPKHAPAADEVLVDSTEVEAPEAARSLKGNDQEEAHEDREQSQYTASGRLHHPDGPGRLDVAG
ncbi:MAG: hypothetical protein SFY69_06300 [Planctomycetota bacterium]|nr:hypothetical protein [Planctomycetota bacterium]